MGYKKVDKAISFAEGALLRSMENNRSVKMMGRIGRGLPLLERICGIPSVDRWPLTYSGDQKSS